MRGDMTPQEYIKRIPNKVGGLDGTDSNFYKRAPTDAIKDLDEMMCTTHTTGYQPLQAHMLKVALLDKLLANDDRPITLTAQFYRTMAAMPSSSVKKWEQALIGPWDAAAPGRGGGAGGMGL